MHKAFLEIARTEGQKSQDKKKALINKLLVAAGQNEAGYIMRCLQVTAATWTLHVSLVAATTCLPNMTAGVQCATSGVSKAIVCAGSCG